VVEMINSLVLHVHSVVAVLVKNGLTGVNHLEYNLPLTRGAYHTDLGSSWWCCLEVVDFSKVGQIRSWSFLETCLGFGHMGPIRVLEIHSSSILFC